MGLCVCVEEVTLIRINLWLTLFKKHRHHSSGGLHQTLRCTSQAQLLFMIWPAHFLSPALMPPHSHPRPLRYHLSFEAYPERWIIASSWPSTSFPVSGSTVQHADRDPYTFFFFNKSSPTLTQVTLLHRWTAVLLPSSALPFIIFLFSSLCESLIDW